MIRIIRSQLLFTLLLTTGLAGCLQAQSALIATPSNATLSAQAGSTTTVTVNITLSSSGDLAGNHLTYFAFVEPGASWLTIPGNQANGTTPGSITASANPSGLPAGVYVGQIEIVANGATDSPLIVPISFTIGALTATPGSLSFFYLSGGTVPLPQVLAVVGPATPVAFSASTTVTSGSNWLVVTPTTATTPSTVTVSVDAAVIATLAAGSYTGDVVLTPGAPNVPLNVPVTLVVTSTPQVSVSPQSLNFLYQTGGTENVTTQTLSLTSNGGPVNFAATTSVSPNSAGVQWLMISGTSAGATPGTLTIALTSSAASLPAGTYTGQVIIVVPSGSPLIVNVTLTASTLPLLSVTPTSLTFGYQVGTALPPAQTITTSSTGGPIGYSPFPITKSGGNWLVVFGGGTTPNPTTVSINPTGLATGTYSATIQFTATGAGNSPQLVPVTLTVTNNALVEAAPNALTFLYQTGKSAPAAQQVSVTSTTGAPLDFTVAATTTTGGNWLSAVPMSGTTTGTFNAVVATANLAAGTYTGTITVTATNPAGLPVANSPLTIPVTYYVSPNPLLKASPAALTFTTTPGGTSTVQFINMTSTSDALNYTITTQTMPELPWLAVTSQPGVTPGSFTVNAVAFNLAPGTYHGSVMIAATNPSGDGVADSPVVVPVTLQVVLGALTVAPTSLNFTQAVGGSAPPAQNLTITTNGTTPLNFTAITSTDNGVSWLSATPTTGATPGTVAVSVNGSSLALGTYKGSITISATNASSSPQTIPITLTIASAPALSISPGSLTFTSQIGLAAPAAQTLAVTSPLGALTFTAGASTVGTSGDWLAVTPASGSTPGNLSVTVNPAGLAVGTYTGSITVTSTGASNSPQTIAVTYTVAAASVPMPTSVVNAASGLPGSIAPGEIISIYGTNLGPVTGVYGTVANNTLTSGPLAGVQVKFGNNLAPLLYVSATQINAIVPFELTGLATTQLEVSNFGTLSAVLDLNIATAAPGLFTLTENGKGQGAILNQNSTVNGTSNPAARGSVIVLYATGGGQTTPAGVTGNITPSDGTGLKQVPDVSVTVGDQVCNVIYHGSAPGFVEGALQINVELTTDVPSGPQPVVVSVGGVVTAADVTVVVQ